MTFKKISLECKDKLCKLFFKSNIFEIQRQSIQIIFQKNLWKAKNKQCKLLFKQISLKSYANYFKKTILLSVNKSQIYTFLPFYIYFQITQNNVLFTTQKNPYT